MKRVVVCSGGPSKEVVDFKQLPFHTDEVIFIGADRGALHLIEQGILPNEAIGDFDSLTQEEQSFMKKKIQKVTELQMEKDETDTHIAILLALEYKPDEIIVTGVTGGRLDHYEAALHDICRFQLENPTITFAIQNNQNIIQFLSSGTHAIDFDSHYKYVSFFSFGKQVENMILNGFMYDVEDEYINVGNAKFTSNELKDRTGTISFTAGICLMIRSSD
ncbi:thiamine diphosphokinase [Psychrobacillus sp. FSL K6-2836]|uniref:thiamine diphosphokinase n=1 Tax=Psychrobacillus sp. FSL K6-2836 TaxID=2921548 RepID=UPI0030F5F511